MMDVVHAHGPTATWVAADHSDLLSGRDIVVVDDDRLRRDIADIEVLLCQSPPRDVWARAVRLRLIQCVGVGMDGILPAPGLADAVRLCNASGLSSRAMGEFAVAQLLALLKAVPQARELQRAARWEPVLPLMLAGRTIAVLGAGPVGRSAASLLRAWGARVIGVTRRPRPISGFDDVLGLADLRRALERSDDIILAIPAHRDTHGLIGHAELAALRPGGHLVNIARGSLVDERALLASIEGGRLRGAALDTAAHEPLPADDPLWSEPRILLTAHVSWTTEGYAADLARLLARNLDALEDGRALENEVDRVLGYHLAAD